MGNKHGNLEEQSSDSNVSPNITELAKILVKKALQENNVKGIPDEIFAKYVFPSYQHLGRKLFAYLKIDVESTASFLSNEEFCTAVGHVLEMEEDQIDMYMTMYAENGQITQKGFRNLVSDAYTIAADHCHSAPIRCPHSSLSLKSLVNGAFQKNLKLSVSQLRRWILSNCPRLTVEMHRYIIFTLSRASRMQDVTKSGFQANIPVVDEDFSDEDIPLPLSEIWLLAVSLPEVFFLPSSNDGTSTTSQSSTTPSSHWTKLYMSDDDGLGLNRFNNHVMNYRDPTVTIIECENNFQFCIAASCEWRESTQNWGTEDCMVIEMFPKFKCVLRNTNNILYFNGTLRGYPSGIRAGDSPNNPILSINYDFTFVTYNFTRNGLLGIQVWGCGSEEAIKSQLDIRHRKNKDVEKANVVKLNPQEWKDNPDRYLLSLGGHTTYSSGSKKPSTRK